MAPKHLFSCTIVGVAVAMLSACSDGVTVNRSEVAGGYSGMLYTQSQAAGGTNAVVVRNDPFPDAAVLTALRSRYQSDQYRFGLGPSPENWNGYTLVFGFGGAPIGNQNLCQNPNLPLRPTAASETSIVGDYCYGAILITEAQGWTSAVNDPNDPRFQKLVGDVTAELFAYRLHIGHQGSGGSTTR